MILYKYTCSDCEVDTYVDWFACNDCHRPQCCNCGNIKHMSFSQGSFRIKEDNDNEK